MIVMTDNYVDDSDDCQYDVDDSDDCQQGCR